MTECAGGLLDAAALDEVATPARRYLDGRERLLRARVEQGLVRDGHGDLLADDIFCLPEGPQILDCIEFDDRLRFGDVVADVAFLAMDLERLGAPELAARFLSHYEAFSAERHPASLIEYYIAFRALIRSKVACIRAGQADDEAPDQAASLLAFAAGHLRRGRVRLVLVGGAPGTGKSTLAAGLADRRGWLVLRSDEVRKDLAGMARTARAEEGFGEGNLRRAHDGDDVSDARRASSHRSGARRVRHPRRVLVSRGVARRCGPRRARDVDRPRPASL